MVMINNILKVFIAVAEKKSITAVANDLFISQPAVSKAIKNIEDELHIKLFQRDKRNGLMITDVGEKVLLLARQMIDIENKIYQTAFRENNFLGGKLKIASVPIASTTIISKAMSTYKNKYPFVQIELLEGSTVEVKKWVEDYVVDFGIGISPFDNLEYRVLVRDKMVGISQEKLASGIDLSEKQENLIFCKAGREVAFELLYKEHDVRLTNYLNVQNAETVISMVENGVGRGIISQYVLSSNHHSLYTCEVKPLIEMEYALITHSFDELTPVAKEFVRIILELISC